MFGKARLRLGKAKGTLVAPCKFRFRLRLGSGWAGPRWASFDSIAARLKLQK